MTRAAALAAGWGALILLVTEALNPLPMEPAVAALGTMARNLGVPSARNLGPLLWALSVWVVLQAGCLGAGGVAGRWTSRRGRRPGPPDPVTALCLGWLAASLILLAAGVLGLFRVPVLAAVAAASLLASPRSIAAAVAGERTRWLAPAARVVRLIRWSSAAVLAAVGIAQLAPETHIDSLIYHLGIAGRLVQRGRLFAPDGNFLHHFPLASELLRGWGLALGGEPSARLWTFGALVAGAIAVRGAVARLAGGGWGWAAFGLWATSPLAAGMAAAGKPDVFTAAFGVVALSALLRGGRKGALVAGLLGGAAAGTKFQGAIAVPVLSVLALYRRGSRAASLCLVVAGAAAAAGPWMAKSALLTGDPVYPFGKVGVGMPAAAVDQLAEVTGTMALRGNYDGWARRLAAGWTATMTDGMPPLWLALVPLALAGAVRSKRFRGPAAGALPWWIAGGIGWVAWNLGPPQPRYAMNALAWLTVPLAAGLAGGSVSRPGAWLAGTALAFQVLRTATAVAAEGAWAAGLGLEAPESFRARSPLAVMDRALAGLPPGSRVMLAGEWRAWPAPRDLVVPSLHEPLPAWPLIRAARTPDGLARRWRELGVTHVVQNYAGALFNRNSQTIYRWDLRDLAVWTGFWRTHARLLESPDRIDWKEGAFYVYGISPAAHAPRPTPTLPGIEGLYAVVEGHLRLGDRAGALARVDALDRIAGDFPQVMVFTTRLRDAGDPERQLFVLEKAAKGGYRDPLVWAELARLCAILGRPAEAEAWRRTMEGRVARP